MTGSCSNCQHHQHVRHDSTRKETDADCICNNYLVYCRFLQGVRGIFPLIATVFVFIFVTTSILPFVAASIPGMQYIFYLLVIGHILTLGIVVFMDPGVVSRESDASEPEEDEGEMELENLVTSETSNDEDYYYCKLCRVRNSKGARHCDKCKHCVLHQTHHCGWLGICVTTKNRVYFFANISIGIAALIFAWILGIITFVLNMIEVSKQQDHSMWTIVYNAPFASLCVMSAAIACLPACVRNRLYFFSFGFCAQRLAACYLARFSRFTNNDDE